jgi:transposase
MPKTMDIKQEELDGLLERVKSNELQEGDYELIKALVETVAYLNTLSNEKAASIKRLLKMVFGNKTEKQKRPNTHDRAKRKKKKKGHGRNGAKAYKGAKKIKISHQTLKSGNDCPACDKGKLYGEKPPARIVRITGGAPFQATVYELQRLRCNLCGQIFTAQAPDNVGKEKYDAKSGAMLALLKYGSGVPLYRLGKLQASLGMPLPPSTQWEIIEGVADKIHPVHTELIRQAAQGKVLYNDDTTMKILSLMKETDKAAKRKGMFTSGILSECDVGKIALFFTGRNHAGENLSKVLQERSARKDPPIQMCDALSRNLPKGFESIFCNCLVHGRRNFVDIMDDFPEKCNHVIETLAKIYAYDQEAKEQHLDDEKRLRHHQTHSRPLMQDLKRWLETERENKEVEPNSSLGRAISYMLKHWEALTRFLKVPGAPLDNNLCEQLLKKSILHRKNSLFYKTEHGAYIGDLFMSLIHTCNLQQINPFEYLTCLQKHSSEIFQNPADWLPWTFETTIAKKTEKTADNL